MAELLLLELDLVPLLLPLLLFEALFFAPPDFEAALAILSLPSARTTAERK